MWPRDLVETAGGLLAAGATMDARRVLDYLRIIQLPDGGWTQNCWLDGTPYWRGVQMDECAFPILLVDMCRRHGALQESEVAEYWPMVRAAAAFVLRNGPVTGQDRWEEDGGYTPFTLAVEIAGLLVAADFAEEAGEPALGALCRDTADAWNEAIESWCFAPDSPPARARRRLRPLCPHRARHPRHAASDVRGQIAIKNRPPEKTNFAAEVILSPDALALVRFGPAPGGRSPHGGHHRRDRRQFAPRTAGRALLVSLQRRRLRRARGWPRLRRHRHRRLWPLLTGERGVLRIGRRSRGGGAAAVGDAGGSDHQRLHDPRTGLGLVRRAWSRTVSWPADRRRDAARLGAFRAYQALPLAGRRRGVRLPAATLARYAEGRTPARVQPWRPDWRAATVAETGRTASGAPSRRPVLSAAPTGSREPSIPKPACCTWSRSPAHSRLI